MFFSFSLSSFFCESFYFPFSFVLFLCFYPSTNLPSSSYLLHILQSTSLHILLLPLSSLFPSVSFSNSFSICFYSLLLLLIFLLSSYSFPHVHLLLYSPISPSRSPSIPFFLFPCPFPSPFLYVSFSFPFSIFPLFLYVRFVSFSRPFSISLCFFPSLPMSLSFLFLSIPLCLLSLSLLHTFLLPYPYLLTFLFPFFNSPSLLSPSLPLSFLPLSFPS